MSARAPGPAFLVAALLLLAGAAAVLLPLSLAGRREARARIQETTTGAAAAFPAPPEGATLAIGALARLNAPGGSAADDVRLLVEAHRGLRQVLGERTPPVGDDRDLALALLGRNPDALVLLPVDSPALDRRTGRMVDRWGTPYHLHALGGGEIEVRSAGPDGRLFNGDDVRAGR
jgi:hypothetical protein